MTYTPEQMRAHAAILHEWVSRHSGSDITTHYRLAAEMIAHGADAVEALAAKWHPIATAPKDGTVILRPHVIWGAMDVRYNVKGLPVTALTAGVNWEWLNGDYTTAWPDTAFHPWWMPLPSPPALGLTGEEPR